MKLLQIAALALLLHIPTIQALDACREDQQIITGIMTCFFSAGAVKMYTIYRKYTNMGYERVHRDHDRLKAYHSAEEESFDEDINHFNRRTSTQLIPEEDIENDRKIALKVIKRQNLVPALMIGGGFATMAVGGIYILYSCQ
jgi:hypothetical protein